MGTERTAAWDLAGFTLIEIMVVMAIFVIGILAVGGMQVRAVSSNSIARKSTHATALAADRMEKIFNLAYDAPALADRSKDGVAGLDNDTVETADGCDSRHPLYTVCWNVAQIPEAPNPDTILYKRIRIIVAWMERGVLRRHPLDTIKTGGKSVNRR